MGMLLKVAKDDGMGIVAIVGAGVATDNASIVRRGLLIPEDDGN